MHLSQQYCPVVIEHIGAWMSINNKNMKNINNKVSLGFVILFRGVAFFAALLIMVLLLNNATYLCMKLKRYNVYLGLNDYYGITISPDIDTSINGIQRLDDALVSYFKKTIGNNSRLFSVGSQVMLYNDGFIDKTELNIRDYTITVNEAYLKENPVYDTNGKAVEILGETNEYYLLVPEKYRDIETDIKNYYEENNTFLKYYTEDVKALGLEEAHKQVHETVPLNVIYIMDDQEYAVYNLNIYGKLDGIIKNPLVQVITHDNVSDAQIPYYVTSKNYLVKIINDVEMEIFNQVLAETGIDDFILSIDSVNEQYHNELKNNIIAIIIQLSILLIVQLGVRILEKKILKKIVPITVVWLMLSWIISLSAAIIMYGELNLMLAIGFALLVSIDLQYIKRNVDKEKIWQ